MTHTHTLSLSLSFCRTPPDEGSANRIDLYLKTHNIHERHPCPPVGFEPVIPAGQQPQTYALDRAATGTGLYVYWWCGSITEQRTSDGRHIDERRMVDMIDRSGSIRGRGSVAQLRA